MPEDNAECDLVYQPLMFPTRVARAAKRTNELRMR
jgi:hypothetical protein